MCEILNFLKTNIGIIVSISALFIAVFTFYQSKKHNYLSVKPIANILPQDYEDKICVILQNKGVGPLITKSIKFKNKYTNIEKSYLIDFMPDLTENYSWSNFSKASKYILTPNEDKILLEFTSPNIDNGFEKNRTVIRQALKDIKIIIEYTGIYNEKVETLEYELKWYNRHSQ